MAHPYDRYLVSIGDLHDGFLCQLGQLLSKPHWGFKTKIIKKNDRNSDSCSQMTIWSKSAITKSHLGISRWLVVFKVKSISAVSQSVFLHPLGSILTTLGSDSCDVCLDSKVNLKPLIVVLFLCYPGSVTATLRVEVKPGIFRASITIILR